MHLIRLVSRRLLGAVAATVLLVGALCAPTVADPPLVTLKVATTPIDIGAQALWAKDQGFFKKAGLDVEVSLISNGAAIASAVAAAKGKLDDKSVVQKAMEKANFKSVRGNFKFGNNHVPIQNFYLQDVVKNGDDFVLKTVATIVKDSQDNFHDKCPMK